MKPTHSDDRKSQTEKGSRRKDRSLPTRRRFLERSAAAAAGGVLAGRLIVPQAVHASDDDVLRIGLIGCGGRGAGAAVNAVNADRNCRLVAMGDAFADRLALAKASLQRACGDKFAVDDEHCFVGFDAYQQVINADVDLVLLTSPPHFRPRHLAAAVEAGKHCFVEKPIAVDAPGVQLVQKSSELAAQRNLAIVSGLCWRYDAGVRETMDRIFGGAIGDIVAIQSAYNTGTLWHRGDKPAWSRMEYQLRNWLYYTWLSGDHIVEQAVHSLDKTAWLNHDASPVKAVALGGRQQRTDPRFGNIYDHFSVTFEYPTGVKVFFTCRQQKNCANMVDEHVLGTEGSAWVLANTIDGKEKWQYPHGKSKPSMYDAEHQELFASIRQGNPINNGHYMCNSTMIGIMGRMAAYTGQELTWEDCVNSQQRLGPDEYVWGDVPEPVVAVPGITKFA